jgi:hypothetical protein
MMSLLNGALFICVADATTIPVLRTSPPSRPARDKISTGLPTPIQSFTTGGLADAMRSTQKP